MVPEYLRISRGSTLPQPHASGNEPSATGVTRADGSLGRVPCRDRRHREQPEQKRPSREILGGIPGRSFPPLNLAQGRGAVREGAPIRWGDSVDTRKRPSCPSRLDPGLRRGDEERRENRQRPTRRHSAARRNLAYGRACVAKPGMGGSDPGFRQSGRGPSRAPPQRADAPLGARSSASPNRGLEAAPTGKV